MKDKLSRDSEEFRKYCLAAVGKFYKVIPLYDERNKGLKRYVESLLIELRGIDGIIAEIGEEARYLTILFTLNQLQSEVVKENNKSVIKPEIYKCINYIKKIGGISDVT